MIFRPGQRLVIPGAQVLQPRATSAAASALYSNLTAFWKMDEASGSRADSIGTSTLTDNNTVASGAGLVYSNAAFLVRANSEYLNCASNSALQSGGGAVDFAIGLWIKLAAVNSRDIILSKGWDGTSTGVEYLLDIISGAPRFLVNGSTTATSVQWGSSIGSSSFAFVLIRFVASENKIYMQVNDGSAVSATHTGNIRSSTTGFRIGTTEAAVQWLDAYVGPVMIWKNYVPTATERTWLYNSGAGRTLAEIQGYS